MKCMAFFRRLAAAALFCGLASLLSATGIAFCNVPLDTERLGKTHLLRGGSEEEYWLADGRLFVHVQDDFTKTWGPSGVYATTIKIDRYFGDGEQIDRQIALGTLPATATLILPNFDCDDKADVGYVAIAPEIDRVCLNGVELGFVSGENDSWAANAFEIPVKLLRLPERPGDIGVNELEITVDIGNDSACWVLYQLWQAIEIDAPDPVLLVHGWTPHADALAMLQETIRERLGLPAELAVVEMDNSPEDNARMLSEQLEELCGSYGVERFSVMAHSKGGLDSRVLVDGGGLASSRVARVMQIATPNAGSHLADIVVEPKGFWQNALVGTLERIPQAKVWVQDTPGVRSLRPAACARFNLAYAKPLCPMNVVIGSLHNMRWPFQKPYVDGEGGEHYNPRWGLMDWVSAWLSYDHDFDSPDEGRHGDSIVSVASAHTAAVPMAASPLVNWNLDYMHPKITDEGGSDVLDVYRPLIMASTGSIFKPNEENPGMHPVGDSASYPKKTRDGGEFQGWREGLPSSLMEEAECPAFGTVEIPLPKFAGEPSRAGVVLWGLPSLASAVLVLPDGREVALESLAAEADDAPVEGFALLLTGACHAEDDNCPDGIARLRVSARAVPTKSRLFYTWKYTGLPRLFYNATAEGDGGFRLQAALERDLPGEVSYLVECAPCEASLLDRESDNVAWTTLPEEQTAQRNLDVLLPLEPEQGYRGRLTTRLRTSAGEILTVNRTEFLAGVTRKTARLESASLEIGVFRREKSAFVTLDVSVPEGADGDSYAFEGDVVATREPETVLAHLSGRAVNENGRLVFTGGVPLVQMEASLRTGDTLAFRNCRVSRWLGRLQVIVPVAARNWTAAETLAVSRSLFEEELYNRPLELREDCFCEGVQELSGGVGAGFDALRIHLAFKDMMAMPQDEEVVFHARLVDSERRQVAKCVAHVFNGRTRLKVPPFGELDGLVFTVSGDDLVHNAGKPPYTLANIYVVLDGVANFRRLKAEFPVEGFSASEFRATAAPPPPDVRRCSPFHRADADHDYRMQPDEVRAAWEEWKASRLSDQLFMNAVYLEGKGEYTYDRRTCLFRPVEEDDRK